MANTLEQKTATPPNREPTLFDVIERLDKLNDEVEKFSSNVKNLSTEVENLSTDVEKSSTEVKRFDERFTDYRQATQWVAASFYFNCQCNNYCNYCSSFS